MRFAQLFAVSLLFTSCKFKEPDIDICGILPDLKTEACFPTSPKREEFDRPVAQGDICVSAEHYSIALKKYKDLLRQCGDRCE